MVEDEKNAEKPSGAISLDQVPVHRRVSALGDDIIGHHFVRFGTAFLIAGDDDREPSEEWEAVAEALRADSRVVEVSGEPATTEWSAYKPVYPSGRNVHREYLLGGHDVQTNLCFSAAMTFKLRVPRKNQPTVYDWTELPTEDYWVAWDGVSVFVLWECDPDEVHPSPGGGHIAFEVLENAALVAGMGLMIQPCSPGCNNLFSHTNIRIAQLPMSAGMELHGIEGNLAVAVVSVDGGPEEVLDEIVATLEAPGQKFALMKNQARRLLHVEDEARDMVAELLAADYARLDLRTRDWKDRLRHALASVPDVVHGGSHRRRAKHMIASLWLAMAGIEVLRRDWDMARTRFGDAVGRGGLDVFYAIDRKDDDDRVTAIKLDFIRSAVEQQSSRIDNHTVAAVTAVGAAAAVVGAVAGGAIGGA